MGILKLADLIRSEAPDAITHKDIGDYTGKSTHLNVWPFDSLTPMLT